MADHVLDGEPPPVELRQALMMKTWGVDAMDAPAWVMAAATPALNAFNALSAYKSAGAQGKAAKWGQENPQVLDFVTSVIRDRMERRWAKKAN